MDSDPRNLDGSDSPSSIQAPPRGYAKLKESSLPLGLAGPSIACDLEARRGVSTCRSKPIRTTCFHPDNEIIEKATKSGLDAIVSHISTYIPRAAHPTTTLKEATSAQRSFAAAQSSSQGPLGGVGVGGGENAPSHPALSGPDTFGALDAEAQLDIPPIPAKLQSRSTTTAAAAAEKMTGRVRPTSWKGRLRAAMSQRDPLANVDKNNMVSVYMVHLVWGEWGSPNPDEGLKDRLNATINANRIRQWGFSSGWTWSVQSQGQVIEAFMGQGSRTIALICSPQKSAACEQALLVDIKNALKEIPAGELAIGSFHLGTQLAVARIERNLVRSIF